MTREAVPADLGDVAVGAKDEIIEDPGKAEVAAYAGDQLETSAVEKDRQAVDARVKSSLESPNGLEGWDNSPEADRLEEEATQDREQASRLEDKAAEQYEFGKPESISDEQRAELAEQAAADWKREQFEIYTTEVRKAVGTIEAIKRGLIKNALGRLIGVMRSPDISRRDLDKDLKEKLRAAIYQEAGVPVPEDGEFKFYGDTSENDSIAPNARIERVEKRGQNDVMITQDRFYRRRLGVKVLVADEIYVGNASYWDRIRNPDLYPDPHGSDPHDY